MKYTVILHNESGTAKACENLSKSDAVITAKEFAANAKTGELVFVTWYRASDGQHGYLNPDGDHTITGKAW